MKLSRRACLASSLTLPGLLHPDGVHAAAFPTRPLRLVVPFAPGGPADAVARMLAPRLEADWGQPLVVENRAGAGGSVGTAFVARAAADGHTLLLTANSHAINPALLRNLPFDTARAFAGITPLTSGPFLLVVHPSVPARTLAELIALARTRPGALNYASPGNGTGNHLAMELLKSMTGTDLLHVPFSGAGPATAALLSGEVPIMFNNTFSALPHLPQRGLVALATGGVRRLELLPDVPTVAETLPGFEAVNWYGVLAPIGTPAPIVETLNAGFTRAISASDLRPRLVALGIEPAPSGAAEFDRFIVEEIARWGRVARSAGLQPD